MLELTWGGYVDDIEGLGEVGMADNGFTAVELHHRSHCAVKELLCDIIVDLYASFTRENRLALLEVECSIVLDKLLTRDRAETQYMPP